jgi:hypothetical protein
VSKGNTQVARVSRSIGQKPDHARQSEPKIPNQSKGNGKGVTSNRFEVLAHNDNRTHSKVVTPTQTTFHSLIIKTLILEEIGYVSNLGRNQSIQQ